MEKLIKDNWTAIREVCRYAAWKFHMDIDDIHGEVLERIVKNYFKYKEQSNFKAWVRTMVYTYCIDEYRRSKKMRCIDIANAYRIVGEDATDRLGNADLIHRIDLFMQDNFDETEIAILKMRAHGFKFGEIATMLNMNPNTVRTYFFRANLVLQQQRNNLNSIAA